MSSNPEQQISKIIKGDNVEGDKVIGDKVGGDKIVVYHLKKDPAPLPFQRPPRADHFTGRQDELDQLLADIRPGHITTLCGPGGIGKTALAIEALWSLAPSDDPPDQFPDGIVYHNFYNQPQIAIALEKIAFSFGQEPRPDPATIVRTLLNRRRCLILLDGAENADDLTTLLDCRGQAAILITTRRHEDAPAGWQDIRPLQPEPARDLLQSWAGAYAQDNDAADQICRLVGYLPLALRLAGRYMAHHSQNAFTYLTWLQETPLAALDHGARQRHSVPILMERSCEALTVEARDTLALTGLLALESFPVEPVAASLQTEVVNASRYLGNLVNHGLILTNQQATEFQTTHALIHAYSRRQLAPPQGALSRLAAYYTALAHDQSKLGLPGYTRLDVDLIHIMAVLSRCSEQKEWGSALGLAQAVGDQEGYLDLKGLSKERVIALETGLKAARALRNYYDVAAHLTHLGSTYSSLSQVETAIDYYQQALVFSRKINFLHGEIINLSNLGSAYHILGKVDKAIRYLMQALAIQRRINFHQGEAYTLDELGKIYRDLGKAETAIEYHRQALTIFKKFGPRHREANTLSHLGNAYATFGKSKKAIKYNKQAHAICQEIGYRVGEANALGNLGTAHHILGKAKKAIKYHKQALVIHQDVGYRQSEAIGLDNLGNAYEDLGQVETAIDYHQQALAVAREVGYRQGEANALFNLGSTYRNQGQMEMAADHLKQALFISEAIKSPHVDQVRTWLEEMGAADPPSFHLKRL